MEKSYTESELRQKLVDRADYIATSLTGKLRDDDFSKRQSIRLSEVMHNEGTIISDLTPFREWFESSVEEILLEFLPTLLDAFFDDTAP